MTKPRPLKKGDRVMVLGWPSVGRIEFYDCEDFLFYVRLETGQTLWRERHEIHALPRKRGGG